MRKDSMFIVHQSRPELDRLQKYLDKLSQPYRHYCDQSGNRFGPTDRESCDLYPRPSIKSWRTFIFQWSAVSRIMGMLDTRGSRPIFLMVRNVVPTWFCERIFCHETVDKVEWVGQREREVVSIDVTTIYGWNKPRSPYGNRSIYLDIYWTVAARKVLLHFISQGTLFASISQGTGSPVCQ